MKVIQNPEVLAPHLRNYYSAVKGARLLGKHKISFHMNEPYFRNDVSLGRMWIIPRHFYDPDGLLAPVDLSSLTSLTMPIQLLDYFTIDVASGGSVDLSSLAAIPGLVCSLALLATRTSAPWP